MKKVSLLLLVNLFIAPAAFAEIIDVSDFKMLEIARHQLNGIEKNLDKLDQERQVLKNSQNMMQGHYQYSSMFSDPGLSSWQHSGKDWSSLLGSYEGNQGGALSAIASQMAKEFPISSSQSVFGESRSEQAKLFDLLAKTSLASRASQTLGYNNIDAELLMLEKLQREIEKSPNQKATLDLIARIQIENAKLTAYQIKSNAITGQLASLESQQEISDTKWVNDFLTRP